MSQDSVQNIFIDKHAYCTCFNSDNFAMILRVFKIKFTGCTELLTACNILLKKTRTTFSFNPEDINPESSVDVPEYNMLTGDFEVYFISFTSSTY